METYKPTIGIEVHAELKTNTKMFCDSKNDPHDAHPNTHVCPVCMGHPGTLPVINKAAVEHVLMVGTALGGKLASYTEFDRKNYFYPDIPKGYQISQYEHPLVSGGELAGVDITRVHLEEDTARSLHDQGDGSVIDFNRAGVPLMELVTEPVIHDAETAGNFARELQLLLKTLGVSDANMERGEMRVEANISVSKNEVSNKKEMLNKNGASAESNTLGTKVEVKNLNSFKSVESAIIYEVERQIEVLENGGVVVQETRGWDENKNRTFSQRVKESAEDYRYFPDPDLPKLRIEKETLSRIKENLPELPKIKREKYSNLGIAREQIETIISSKIVNSFFDRVLSHIDGKSSKLAANYVTTDLLPIVSSSKVTLTVENAKLFAELITLVASNEINSRVTKDLLPRVMTENKSPQRIAEEEGLLQDSSKEALGAVIAEIISENPKVAEEYRGGKEASIQFLVGQGMKKTKGAANPALLKELLQKELKK